MALDTIRTQKPHVPTLFSAVVVLVVVLFLYHVTIGRRGRR